jgi:hypothetical protein
VQALPRLVPSGEEHAVLAAARLRLVRDQDAVRDHLVVTGQPALGRLAGALGDRDPVVEPVDEEPPDRLAEPHPAQIAGRVEGPDHRRRGDGQRGRTRGRRHRFVQVENVEALALERPPDAEEGARREDDVRQRPVRRHDHRAADRDHLGRRVAVPADAGMQGARELAGRVVAHDQSYVVAPLSQRRRLQLGVLDDGTPERPRERHDDADLHCGPACGILGTMPERAEGASMLETCDRKYLTTGECGP